MYGGLKPWELDDFTLQQYVWYMEGVQSRDREHSARLRKIYGLIHDVNVKSGHQISGNKLRLEKHWPIEGMQKAMSAHYKDVEAMRARIQEQKRLSIQYGTAQL